jgi:tetratricopeptide (TPR) repeat protein/DNA-binding SARP family transcriptional activator
MRFGLLGPLLVDDGTGGEPPVAGARQRMLLAALLVHANRVVPAERLADIVWDGAPPAGAAALRTQVMRLRRVLGSEAAARVITRTPGYMITLGIEELDITLFETLYRDAGAAVRAGRWSETVSVLDRALALWRGAVLLDVESQVLRDECGEHLEQLRVQAKEWRVDAGMRLGRHDQLVLELRDLVRQYPLREHLHAQLMLALYRSGQQAEALEAYQSARGVLREELGTEPGTALQALHQRMLTADPALAAPEPVPTVLSGPGLVVPRQLPASVRNFTGRSDELGTLTRLLSQSDAKFPGTVVISAIGGTAGVGKTALAVHWAHQVADRFPDGQLYVNLRGYDPGEPVPTADVLAGFLLSLGVSGQDIPPEAEQRAARYRSLLAGKQVLVVLDNARSADQVRPLLPGSPACAVVVTSRDALAGLVARDGAARLDLDVLPPKEAITLLRTLIGARAAAEPAAAAELAAQCCRLPLALRVAAELAASRPAVPLSGLVNELADLRARLDLLDAGGDPRTQVRAVFSWSYRHLDTEDARAFRLLGLHPGPDFEPYAAAALVSATVPQARRALDVLVRTHLIQPAAPGRYSMHDLLRGYARELTATLDTGNEQHTALTRLFDHYLHTAATAMDTLFPAERHRRPHIPRPATPVPPLTDPAAAREWLNRERVILVATAMHTAAHDWPGHATRLAATLASYLHYGGHIPEAVTVFGHALGAARRTGDRAAEATILNQIGQIDCQQSRIPQAAGRYRQALTLFREAGDQAGEALALGNVGLSEMGLGRYEHAARYQHEAVVIWQDIGDRLGEACALGNLGLTRRRQGRYQEAADYHQQSLDLFRAVGDRQGEGWALARLGVIDLRLGRYQRAAGYLQQALSLFQEIGSTVDKAEILARLGDVYVGLGRYEQAAGNFEHALAAFREIGNPSMEADALNGLGEILFRLGETEKAHAHHAAALRLASEAGSPEHQARAHSGLARACQADGAPVQARHHWQQALTRYAAIGAPEADEIRARLAMIADGGDKPTEEDGGTTVSTDDPPGRTAI